MINPFHIADLFCGGGGYSQGALEAVRALGHSPTLTAVNHWDIAVHTHKRNHPEFADRTKCASLDSLNPRHVFPEGQLDLLIASPECTHHSSARGGKPINDQSRSSAFCVMRWAEALRPPVILIENVPEFATWGPIGTNGRPLKSRKGEIFRAFCGMLESLGYRVDHRVLCAADYGDPTTRQRLFIQAVRGHRKIVWPEPTHAAVGETDLFGSRQPWASAKDHVIDWSIQGKSIFSRKRPLSPNTLARIRSGLVRFGLGSFLTAWEQETSSAEESAGKPSEFPGSPNTRSGLGEPFLVQVNHRGGDRVRSVESPMQTIAGNRGEWALCSSFIMSAGGPECGPHSVSNPMGTILTREHRALVSPFLIPQGGGGVARVISEPTPTVACDGAIALVEPFIVPQHSANGTRSVSRPAPTVTTTSRGVGLAQSFLVPYYSTGVARDLEGPLDTVTTRDRFGLVQPVVLADGVRHQLDIRFRMLQPHELARAQGFHDSYQFSGNKTDVVKQIGNAVPRRLARALVLAAVSQQSDISDLLSETARATGQPLGPSAHQTIS